MRKCLLCLAVVAFFVAGAVGARGQESSDGAQLKSAGELVELLTARLGADYEIPTQIPYNVIACDQNNAKIVIFKTDEDWNKPESILWKWDTRENVSEEFGKTFAHVDECKPARGTDLVLVTSSYGGIAVVRVEDKKVIFYGLPRGNTHSIALLPDGNVVSISSTGAFIALFATTIGTPDEGKVDVPPITPIHKKYELEGGHGLVWDAKRNLLWALGSKEIVAYRYNGDKTNPELIEQARQKLEGAAYGGHDLYPAPGYDALMTTGRGVSVFDPDAMTFTTVWKRPGVKSVSITPDGAAALVQLPNEEWWNESLYYGDAKETVVGTSDGARFYKARWFVKNEFSEPSER